MFWSSVGQNELQSGLNPRGNVTLPESAVAILHDLNKLTGHHSLVFPSMQTRQKPLSENTMNKAIRSLGFGKEDMTAHGFRATASTLLNESGNWLPDAIEAELAHVGTNEVRRAYHRAAYWDERIRMCEWWAVKIGELREMAPK